MFIDSITLIETISSTDYAIAAAGHRACAAGSFVANHPILLRLKEQEDQALEAFRSDHLSEVEVLDLLEGIITDADRLAAASTEAA